MAAADNAVQVIALAEALHPAGSEAIAQIEAIFFASAATKSFASEAERHAYRERWLGRYLKHFPAEFFVALAAGREVLGYLAGCPAITAAAGLFSDIEYYSRLPSVFEAYPAHFHINVREDCRARGIGANLVAAFIAHCSARGIAGAHVVTAAEARAMQFYRKCGFAPVAHAKWNGREIAALGRAIAPLRDNRK